jgi:hypothetical protein
VRLECTGCGTGIDGDFSPWFLSQLSREHRDFVQTFLKCRGKMKDVGEELGLSYPTVAARLNDVLAALGFEVSRGTEFMPAPSAEDERAEERLRVLDALEAGQLTATEAVARLRELA